MNKIIIISFVLFFGIPYSGYAQTKMDRQLANSYYGEGQYDKAVIYYEKIFKTDNSIAVFEPYFKSLVQLGNYKLAEKICKKEIKKFPNLLKLKVDLGTIYEQQGNTEKANDIYDNAIDAIGKQTKNAEINRLANAFESEGKLDLAIKTYQVANTYAGTSSMYNRKIAMLYGRQGKTKLMIESLLDIIDEDERYVASVQGALNSAIDFKEDKKKVELLKTSLIKRSQANPNRTINNEMLAWVYMLTENYKGAFIQLKAIDKKEQNDGARIHELGITSINNKRYEDAIKCFQYVIDLGGKKPFYTEAKIYKLSALKKKVLEGGIFSKADLLELEQNYESSLANLGWSNYTIELVRDLAKLEGYYLNNPKKGIELLEKAGKLSSLNSRIKAEVKIELGDLMVIDDRIWDASLLFMQVENQFKEDRVGHLAKFKAAQVFYYAGDFDFAQGQLDVLKASTSKLIANDAMELSMLITDNYNMDTTQVTMQMYAAADLLIQQHRYEEASATFDSITAMFNYHTLNDEILWKRSEMALNQQKTDEAITYLKEITTTYGDDILADNATFKLATIYEYTLNDKETAAEYYKKIIFDFKGSLFGVEARKHYRAIKPSSTNDFRPIIDPDAITP